MKPKCPVTYSRTACAPFMLGIEGMKCILSAKHDCDHMGRYVAEFAQEGREDKMAEFHFRIDAPLMTLSEEEKFAESVEKSGRDRAAKESFIREPKTRPLSAPRAMADALLAAHGYLFSQKNEPEERELRRADAKAVLRSLAELGFEVRPRKRKQ